MSWFVAIFIAGAALARHLLGTCATKLCNPPMLESFFAFMLAHQLLPQNGATLLAVSGGIDSVLMTQFFHQAKLHFSIAHCNFGLRGGRQRKTKHGCGLWPNSMQWLVIPKPLIYWHMHAQKAYRHRWLLESCAMHGFRHSVGSMGLKK